MNSYNMDITSSSQDILKLFKINVNAIKSSVCSLPHQIDYKNILIPGILDVLLQNKAPMMAPGKNTASPGTVAVTVLLTTAFMTQSAKVSSNAASSSFWG